jgi:phosphopantothenoylcysteine decarboxylase/phosphopantothenate--cysteine ligase
MMNIAGKKILILVTGGIAAYKINTLVRDFIKSNAEVQVVLTPDAEKFVTTLTLSTLSKNPVFSTFYSDNGEWNSHVELALWADAILVAPCTANTLAKISHGLCDNLVMAVYLSAKCPVFIAPAMDLDMYQHPTTKKNLETISGFGNYIIPAESGELASGLVGEGRMAEPETIFATLNDFFQEKKSGLKDKKILITAGPTYEAIDPVRFIGNHSSGKMGLALAAESCKRGAQVIVILGPTSLHYQHPNLQIIRVTSAKEMMTKVLENYDNAEIAIA